MAAEATPVGRPVGSLAGATSRVGAGLAVSGAATYAFAAVATRALGPAGFAEFTVFWGLVFGLGLGVFFPFEQEVSRRGSHAHTTGRSGRTVRRTAYRLGLVTALGLAAIAYPLARVLASPGHALGLWATTATAFVALAVAYVSRGGLSGRGLFARYGGQLAVEGVIRLVLALALLVVGATSPWSFAVAVPIALLVAVAATAPRRPSTAPADPLTVRALAVSVSAIVVSSTVAQSLVNLGPVAVTWLSPPGRQDVAGSFLAAALVARMPVFAFAAVQAVLIPRLVRAVVRRQHAEFARSLRLVLGATLALAVLGVALSAAVGPQLLHLLAGPGYDLGRVDMALLAAMVGFYLLAMVLQPAAISLGRHRAAMVPWLACALAYAATLTLPLDPVRRVGVALVVAGAVAVVGLGVVVGRGWAADQHARRP